MLRLPGNVTPNTAPVTKTDSHDWSCSRMIRHLQCAEQHDSPSNLTKYCVCFEKRLSWLILLTYETSFTMRGATRVAFQLHQILPLPRKIALQNLREICWKRIIYIAGPIRPWSEHDPTMNSSSRTREVSFRASEMNFVMKITAFRAPAICPHLLKCCACHEKWHSNICCACHETWHSNSSKCCACHEK